MDEEKNIKIPVEVYSRVVGYFRPVSNWNKGKKEEFREKKFFKIPKNLSESNGKNTKRKI